jgi:hypothetical protein
MFKFLFYFNNNLLFNKINRNFFTKFNELLFNKSILTKNIKKYKKYFKKTYKKKKKII